MNTSELKFNGSKGTNWKDRCYFSWAELYDKMNDNAKITYTVASNDAYGETEGVHNWRIPSGSGVSMVFAGEWCTIINNPPFTAININDIDYTDDNGNNLNTANILYVNVSLSDAPSDYQGRGLGYSGNGTSNTSGSQSYQSGVLLVPDGAKINCSGIKAVRGSFSSETVSGSNNVIKYKDLETLTKGGCIFLLTGGSSDGGTEWYGGGNHSYYWASTKSNSGSGFRAWSINLYSGGFSFNEESRYGKKPVKLIHD